MMTVIVVSDLPRWQKTETSTPHGAHVILISWSATACIIALVIGTTSGVSMIFIAIMMLLPKFRRWTAQNCPHVTHHKLWCYDLMVTSGWLPQLPMKFLYRSHRCDLHQNQ